MTQEQQKTVVAASEADLFYVLTQHGILSGGQPAQGMGWQYLGPGSVGGAPLAGVHGLIWWTAPPADEVEAAQRTDTIAALRTAGALYEGQEPVASLLGGGASKPTDYELIGILRDIRKFSKGYKVGQHWFHSDQGSRGQQLGLVIAASANQIPPGMTWKTMSGASVPMTAQLAQQIFAAAMASDAAYHAVGEQARAALAAGTLASVHGIQWPAGFGD